MVAASWSRAELAAMLRAWDDALDVPPHRGFRLLDFMFRRFTELCGGTTERTVGSMTIKRKYMKNMVDVIAQFNNLHGRNGDGLDPDEDEEEASNVVVTGGPIDNTSLVSSVPPPHQQQLRWFEMKRSERKEWFLRLNAKSYQFANIDEETFSSVYKLMQIERVVYVDTIGAEEEVIDGRQRPAGEKDEEQQKERQDTGVQVVDHRRRSTSRVPLVRDSAGNWTAQRMNDSESQAAGTISSSVSKATAATSTSTSRVSAEPGTRPVFRRDNDSVFDRLLASSSGRRGDVVMIDAGSWTDDSDSDTNTSVDSDGEDGDGAYDNSYDWSQGEHLASLYFQNQGERGPRTLQAHRQKSSDQSRSNDTLHPGSGGDLHSDRPASLMRFQQQRQQEQPPNPQLLSAVHSLEAQAAELKEILDQEREERQREEQLWEAEKLRRETERREFAELVAQVSSSQDPERLGGQEGTTERQALRKEVLALIRSEEEERRKEDEAEDAEQEEHDRLLRKINRDDKKRMEFDELLKKEQAENKTLVEMLAQMRSERQQKTAERMEILKQIKSIQEENQNQDQDQDPQPHTSDEDTPDMQSSEPNGEVVTNGTNEAEDPDSQSQAPKRRRSLRGSKVGQGEEEGRDSDAPLQPSRTRRKQVG